MTTTQENITTIQAPVSVPVLVNTKEFTAELEWATRFVREKHIPILGNVMLRSQGARLEITATDLETAGITSVGGTFGDISVTVPAKLALKYLKKVSESEVTLSVTDSKLSIRHGDDSECTIDGMPVDSYPELPALPGDGVLLSGLTQAIPRAVIAISTEASRFTLNGALLELGESPKLVSTDGHRLSIASIGCDSTAPARAIIGKFALTELARLDEDSVMYGSDENYAHFVGLRRRIITRKLTGNFPDYQRVIPTPQHSATIETAALLKHGDRVALFADERSHAVKVRLADNKFTIAAALSEHGNARASVATTWEQPEWVSAFNWEYLQDFLALAPKKTAFDWLFKDNTHVCSDGKVIESRNAITMHVEGWDYVVMPMRD